jgi:hypothetical protein
MLHYEKKKYNYTMRRKRKDMDRLDIGSFDKNWVDGASWT